MVWVLVRSMGTCAEGYHNDGTGFCVAAGCADSYHDGGTGRCLPGTVFVNRVTITAGMALVVTMDTCSPGYKNSGPNICVQLGSPCALVTMTAATVFVYRQGNVAWDIKTGVTGRAKSKVCVH